MEATIRDIFFKYAPWLIFIPTGLIVKNKKKIPKELEPILYYLVLSVVTQIISFVFWLSDLNNLPIVHVYTILEALILLWFYSLIFKGVISSYIFIILSISFLVFSLIDSIKLESIYTFNTFGRSIEGLFFIFLSVAWFVKGIVTNENLNLTDNKGINYINGGFFIYFSGSIVLFSFSNSISELAKSLLMNIWSIHTLLLVFLYFSLTLGVLKCRIK